MGECQGRSRPRRGLLPSEDSEEACFISSSPASHLGIAVLRAGLGGECSRFSNCDLSGLADSVYK